MSAETTAQVFGKPELFSTIASQLSTFLGGLLALLGKLNPEKIKAILEAVSKIVDIIAPLLPQPGTMSAMSADQLALIPEMADAQKLIEATGLNFMDIVKLVWAVLPLWKRLQAGDLSALAELYTVVTDFLKTLVPTS